MTDSLLAAIISAVVALVVALFSFYASRKQVRDNTKIELEKIAHSGAVELARIRAEGLKWERDLQMTLAIEMYRKRLEVYPDVFRILARISHQTLEPRTPELARQVAQELNGWFYSAGGMCAETTTRGAVRRLRRALNDWAESGKRPDDLYDWRNATLLLLRRDLNLRGLESFDETSDDLSKVRTLLQILQKDFTSSSMATEGALADANNATLLTRAQTLSAS